MVTDIRHEDLEMVAVCILFTKPHFFSINKKLLSFPLFLSAQSTHHSGHVGRGVFTAASCNELGACILEKLFEYGKTFFAVYKKDYQYCTVYR